jgi:LysR family transcriptional regulator, nitrogen assimilation regulatory protein
MATVLRQPFIMPISGRHGLRVLLDQAGLGLDVEPNVTAQANEMALQKLLVKAGRGWTVLPAVGVAADVADGIFSAAPICNPEITRTLAIGLQRRDRPAPGVNAVATELVRVIGTAVADGTWPSAELLLNEPRASARVADGRMGRA